MIQLKVPPAAAIVLINQHVCAASNSTHLLYDIGKVESALHSATYPGSYPFAHGGIAGIAGAMCFYLTKAHAFYDGNKRTAMDTAITFMRIHGQDLVYWQDKSTKKSALAEMIDDCAASVIGIDEVKRWFHSHKKLLVP